MNEWMSADVNACMQALTLEDTSGFFVVYSFQKDLGNPIYQKLWSPWVCGKALGVESRGLGPAVGPAIRVLPRVTPCRGGGLRTREV